MAFSQILAISCFLTGIVMAVFVVSLLVIMRFGQQWISDIVERFTNPDKRRDEDEKRRREREREQAPVQPQVASSQALRQRAQSLDFPAPAGGFAAQAAPQAAAYGQSTSQQQPARASLRSRDQYPDFNPQAPQQGQSSGFQPTMPSLSASRPFQGGTVLPPAQPQYPQQQGYQQPQQGAFPQQQGFYPAPQYPQQTQPSGLQPLRPQAPQAPQYPQQTQPSGLQPLRPQAPQPPQFPQQPQQGGFPQQQGFQQQGFQQPQQPQQGGLGEYRPGLSNAPRPDLRTQRQSPVRRDTRRDDENLDDGFGIDGLIDGAGDLLDGF